jgi:hypothetical protein
VMARRTASASITVTLFTAALPPLIAGAPRARKKTPPRRFEEACCQR